MQHLAWFMGMHAPATMAAGGAASASGKALVCHQRGSVAVGRAGDAVSLSAMLSSLSRAAAVAGGGGCNHASIRARMAGGRSGPLAMYVRIAPMRSSQ